MRRRKLPEIHPGEILHQEFLLPLEITVEELVASSALTPDHLRSIVRGEAPMTADVAQCLSQFFDVSASFWSNLQQEYDKRKGLLG